MQKPRDTAAQAKTWHRVHAKGDIPLGTMSTSLVIYDKHIYMFGGETNEGQSSEIYKFSFGLS